MKKFVGIVTISVRLQDEDLWQARTLIESELNKMLAALESKDKTQVLSVDINIRSEG